MRKKYHLEYEEDEQVFTDMYLMYYNNRSSYVYKMIVTFGGILALFIQFFASRTFDIIFIAKFVVLWALAFVAGYLLEKHVIRKTNVRSARQMGQKNYKLRVEKRGTELLVSLDFYEDKFTVVFQDQKEEYSYKEVSRMFESERFFGLVVGGVYGQKAMIGFPASCLEGTDKEAFRVYLAEKCTNVARGFKKV